MSNAPLQGEMQSPSRLASVSAGPSPVARRSSSGSTPDAGSPPASASRLPSGGLSGERDAVPQKLRVPSSGLSPRRKPVPSALELGSPDDKAKPQAANGSNGEPPSPTAARQPPATADGALKHSPSMPYSTPLSSYGPSSAGPGGLASQPARSVPRSSSHSFAPAAATYEPSVPRQRSLGAADALHPSEAHLHTSSTFGSSAATPSSSSRNTPSTSFPMTPDPPSPSNIDRRGLIGVGELATPRWAHSSGARSDWSRAHGWQDASSRSGSGPSSWDYRSSAATAEERNKSWGELASEALAGAQAGASGIVRTGKSESHSLGQHARDISAKNLGLGISGHEDERLTSPRIQPSLLSSYDLSRERTAPPDAQGAAPVSPLTSADKSSSVFAPPMSTQSSAPYAAGLVASSETAAGMGAHSGDSIAPRTHRKRASDQFKLSFGATEAESKAPLMDKAGPPLDLLPWERHAPGTVASPIQADFPKPSPTTPTSTEGRKSRERRLSSSKPTTPSSPGHDIVRQFSASHDFSHLPPSPSSSSIQRFIRQSSTSNLSAAAASHVPAVPSLPQLPQTSSLSVAPAQPFPVTPPADETRRQSTRSGSSPAYPFPNRRASSKNLDPETMEALRRLDGLGRSPSSGTKYSTRSGRTRASSGAADDTNSIRSRPGTPSSTTPERRASGGWSRSSMPAMPSGPYNVAEADKAGEASLSPRSTSFAVARSSQGGSSSVSSKRGSASSTTSPYSTAASSGTRTSVPVPPKMTRKTSASSDTSGAQSDGESIKDRASSVAGRDDLEDIPPVPPLPKAFDLSARSSINQFPSASIASQAAQLSQGFGPASPAVSVRVPPSPAEAVVDLSSDPMREVPTSAPLLSSSSLLSEPEEILAPTRRGSSAEDSLGEGGPPSTSSMSPRRSATKKWSFSSAFNKLSSGKPLISSTEDGSQPMSSTAPTSTTFGPPPEEKSPQIPWTADGNSSPRTDSTHRESTGSYVMTSPPPEPSRQHPSAGSLAAPAAQAESNAQTPGSSGKRLTPSSIPFFRRSSSQSMKKDASASAAAAAASPRPPVPSTPSATSTPRKLSSASIQDSATTATSSSHRKSMLGTMSLSGMLKSSSSRRSLAAAAAAEEHANEFGSAGLAGKRSREPSSDMGEKGKGSPAPGRLTSGLGLLGRRRGKTVSDKDMDAQPLPPKQVSGLPQQPISRIGSLGKSSTPAIATAPAAPVPSSSSSASGSTRRQSNLANPKSNALLRTSRAHLPTISGSPSSGNLNGQAPSIASTVGTGGSISTSSSYSRISDATPTKIPRIASRQSRQLGTPTSAQPSLARRGSETSTIDSSTGGISRTESNLSEFGPVDEEPTATAAAPMQRFRSTTSKPDLGDAATTANRRYSSISTSASTSSFTTSRAPRQLPVPPSSSSAAITASKRLPSKDSLAGSRRLPSSSSVNSGLADVANGGTGMVTPRTFSSKLSSTQPSRITPSSSTTSLATTASVPRSASASPVVIEDDESVGDEEMRQFLKRQRAKKTASGATSAEIEAMMNYPDPVEPTPASTPLATIKGHYNDLSDYERREITEYTDIFCLGVGSKKMMAKLDDSNLNHGYDDDRGDYLVVNGDHLAYRYTIMGVLGKGSFGQVLQCRDHRTGQAVAVKIIRNKKRFHHQALVEVKILDNLRKWDPDQKHCVIVKTEHFYFRNHLCIATELLSINLYELIKANSFAGFTTTLIRRFTVQMLQSLILLRQHRVVHCDLKPENILLAHPAKSGIKVIDFGSSCFEHEKVYTYIQSRFYRSPEVILGCNYSQAIDMWSLGCILAELYTGFPIFPGENEQEQLSCIMEVLGLPDKYIVDKSSRKNIFFDTQGAARPVVNSKGKRRRPGTKTLSQVLKTDDELFVDFIAKCLTWDPDRRLKPLPALRHPWLVKQRLQQQQPSSSAPSSRLSQTAQTAASSTSVTGRIASSLTGTGRAKVTETPKKPLNIGAPTPLSARVRASNIVGPNTPTSNGGGTHGAHSSISSTGSFRQHRASQQPLTTSGSTRHMSIYGTLTSSNKI